MKLSYLDLMTTDPSYNLAMEQHVFDCLPRDRMYFMLWQNDNAIIVGKYQNTIAEINEEAVRERGIRVVRRLSGGGAVYHDMGNLNFTFITDVGESNALDLKLFCEPVVRTLATLGVKAEVNGRNDITIDGKKFSGNSQYIRQGRVMHHGTIMFDSDLSVVGEALRVDPTKIQTKGIRSVRSRVTNVAEHLPERVTLPEFRRILLENILRENPGEEYPLTPDDLAVLELSSFQLMDMPYSPQVAVLTNLAPNHLDVHRDMAEYIDAKKHIFTRQTAQDVLILNADNTITAGFAPEAAGEVRMFSRQTVPAHGASFRDGVIRRDGVPVVRQDEIKIPGLHNVENYMAAILAVEGLASDEDIRYVARNFGGVEHRIEFVRELHGVRYYNDSIATSPTRTIAGLRAFPHKVVLIAGGYDKHIPFAPLAPEVVEHVKTLILCGATADAIERAVDKTLRSGFRCGDIMQENCQLVGCKAMGAEIRSRI
mgnify:CR=1 FL=1